MSEVTERGILMSGDMVRAILDGQKTQTRRPIKGVVDDAILTPRGDEWWDVLDGPMGTAGALGPYSCPYGKPGDLLYVRETFWQDERDGTAVIFDATREVAMTKSQGIVHMENPGDIRKNKFWHRKPSVHMPKWAARIWLRITDVWVERVQDIRREDAIAEGVMDARPATESEQDRRIAAMLGQARENFQCLWDSIYADKGHGWDDNPWVWVVEFEREEKE